MLGFVPILALAAFAAPAHSHMSIYTPSMYGVGPNFKYETTLTPSDPIGPNLQTQDEWWFRCVTGDPRADEREPP
jgi:hypothetical protein